MSTKQASLIISASACLILSMHAIANEDNQYTTEFKGAALKSCDIVFHKAEKNCQNMICRDVLVNAWAECWKKSMNSELNKRLLKLKSSNVSEFHFEMELQKTFNTTIQNLCAKDCGDGGTMKGISYNVCRVDAYKYRTEQAIQINKNQFSIPMSDSLTTEKSHKDSNKDTSFYQSFSALLCKMPKTVWKNETLPADCQMNAIAELKSYTFTDDVCDLS